MLNLSMKVSSVGSPRKKFSGLRTMLLVFAMLSGNAVSASATTVSDLDLTSLSAPDFGAIGDGQRSVLTSTGELVVLVHYWGPSHGPAGTNDYYALAKYSSDSSLDTTFGDSGWIRLPYMYQYALNLLPNDHILVSGGHYDFSRAEPWVARIDVYDNDGVTDTSFGTDGSLFVAGLGEWGDCYPVVHQISVLPSGKLAILFDYRDYSGPNILFVQDFQIRNADGALDTSFSGDGELLLPSPGGSRSLEAPTFGVVSDGYLVQVSVMIAPNTQSCVDFGGGYSECFEVDAPRVTSTLKIGFDGSISGQVPSAPRIQTLKVGNGRVRLGITPPLKLGSAEILGYQYSIDDGLTWTGVDSTSTTTSLTISGLANGTRYMVKVRAVSGIGAGNASNRRGFTPRTVATAPMNVVSSVRTGLVQLDFDAPSNNGGVMITRYGYSINGGPIRNFGASTSPQRLRGLKKGVTYSVRLAALNGAGWGAYSAPISVTPIG